MKVQDLTVEVRNGSYQRVGQLLPADLIGLTVVMRYNNVGSWNITLPSDHRLVDELRAAGAGIIVAVEGEVIFSGYTTQAVLQQSKDNPLGDWSIQGVDDSVILAERLAYPLPSEANVTLQTTANDIRTGVAETVIKGYVYDNISAFAGTIRAIDNLDVEIDLARGEQVTGNARFTNLQELIYGLAQTGKLGFTIKQIGSSLVFQVFEPLDRSLNVRMDVDNGKLTSTEYSYGQPKLTRVIVGGGGEGENRVFYEGSTPESVQAENVWARRVEKFIDSRGSEGTIELEQSAAEALVDEGKTIVNLSVTPADDQTMRFGYDWYLGDKVTVVVGLVETTSVVTEVGLSVSADGVRIGATVGTPVAVDFESKLISAQQDASTRIGNLERNEPALVATTIKQLVNNRTGFTLTKGQAVYINGAQGNRVTVTLAKADAEPTSSKTFGIVQADIPNNQSGYILTEGSITGIDTTLFTEGQAAWLSPDFSGGWTPTKPSAPNHLVLIGFVERVHAVNGSMFVKIQNGFELDEIHNVKITSPTDGQFLKYQASTGLWINSN